MTPSRNTPQDDQLRRAFRAYASTLAAEHTPPSAAAILFRAERRRRLAAIFAAAWLAYRFAPHTLPTLDTTTLALAIACATLVLAGCAAMLHASRSPSA